MGIAYVANWPDVIKLAGVLLLIAGLVALFSFSLKFSMNLIAIVDKDMDAMEAFSYNSAITQNSKFRLLVLPIPSLVAPSPEPQEAARRPPD